MNVKKVALSLTGTFIRMIITILILIAIYNVGLKAYDFGFRIFSEEPMAAKPGRDVEVTIEDGDDVLAVGKLLEKKGLIHDGNLFFVQAKLSSSSRKIKSGVYTLNTSMTADGMIKTMSASKEEE